MECPRKDVTHPQHVPILKCPGAATSGNLIEYLRYQRAAALSRNFHPTVTLLPGRVDDRVAEFGQQAAVVEVAPWMEVAPMVGGDGAPSTAEHPAAPEDKADEPPPRAEVVCRAGAGEDAVADRWERQGKEDHGDPQPRDADSVCVDPVTTCRVEHVEEHRLVLNFLVAVPAEQPGDATVDAVEQLRPRENRMADLPEEVFARHGHRAPESARGPVDDREPSQRGVRDRLDRHLPPSEQAVERRVHAGMGGLLAEEGLAFGAPRRVGDTR